MIEHENSSRILRGCISHTQLKSFQIKQVTDQGPLDKIPFHHQDSRDFPSGKSLSLWMGSFIRRWIDYHAHWWHDETSIVSEIQSKIYNPRGFISYTRLNCKSNHGGKGKWSVLALSRKQMNNMNMQTIVERNGRVWTLWGVRLTVRADDERRVSEKIDFGSSPHEGMKSKRKIPLSRVKLKVWDRRRLNERGLDWWLRLDW